MTLDARKLDRRVSLIRVDRSDDGLSSDAEHEVEIGTFWMSKRDVTDGERIAAEAQGASITTRFQARWNEQTGAATPKYRLRHKALTYEVVAVKELGRLAGVEFTARALL